MLEASKNAESTVGGSEKEPKPVEKFGFHILTYSGYCPLVNDWSDDWVVNFLLENFIYYQKKMKNMRF